MKNRGITLIALVITIIVLLILAGISISALTNQGLFKNAKQTELINKRAQITEYLKLKLINEQTNNPFGSAEEIITATRNNAIENIDDLKKMGKNVTIGEISTEEDSKQVDVYFYVTVDGDLYKVELNGVSFVGKIDEMNPAIKIAKITNTTSTITVEVTTARNEGGKLEYYIKNEDEEEYKLIETSNEESYTYEGLEQGKKYNVKIIAVAKNNKTAEAIGKQITGKVTVLTTANAKFTYAPSGWTNTNVVATASTDVTGFTIQTSLDGQNWSNTPSQTRSANGPVYARLWDGTNAGGMLTGNITKIDKTPATVSISATATGTSTGTLVAVVDDRESGLSQIKWEWGTTTNYGNSATDTYATMNGSGTGTIGSTTKTKNLTGLSAGTTYYVRITAYDVAGNPTQKTATFTTVAIYTVTFNANGGGNLSMSSKIVYSGSQYGTLPSTSRAGYSFNGWFTAPSGGTRIIESTSVTIAGNHVLYAQWTQTDYSAPSISRNSVTAITAIGGGTPQFTVNYTSSDYGSGIIGYYWGTAVPTASSAWSGWSGGSINLTFYLSRTQNATQKGTYYFGVKDACGNINYVAFNWLMCWYDGSENGIDIGTSGYNYYSCGENHWGNIRIRTGGKSGQEIANFTANGGASGTLNGASSVWIGWESFAFTCWN